MDCGNETIDMIIKHQRFQCIMLTAWD